MPELMQPNIVGNFLQSYSSAMDRKQQEQDAAYQKQRQMRQDDMAEQQFGANMDKNQLDMALSRTNALNNMLAQLPDGDETAFEAGKQRASLPVERGGLGIPMDQLAHLTVRDLPRLKLQTGQTLRELQVQAQRANIAQSYAAAAASNRANRGEPAATGVIGAASQRAKLAQATGLDVNSPAGQRYILTGQLPPANSENGKPLSSAMEKDIGSIAEKLSSLREFNSTFDNSYAARGVMGMGGDLNNLYDRTIGSGSAAANWWQQYDKYKNIVRNELFGASLTTGEQTAFEKADINPNMNAETIKKNIETQMRVLERSAARRAASLKAQGYNKGAIDMYLGQPQATDGSVSWNYDAQGNLVQAK